MSDFITTPDAIEEMSPEEYEQDLQQRYYEQGYGTSDRVQQLEERIQKLRDEAENHRANAQDRQEKATEAREEAKNAAAEGKDTDDLFDAATEHEATADRLRAKAEAKEAAADDLEENELEEAKAEEEAARTEALRKERGQRFRHMMDAYREFEEAFEKARAADQRTSDGDATLQRRLTGVDLMSTRRNGANVPLGRQLRRKTEKALE